MKNKLIKFVVLSCMIITLTACNSEDKKKEQEQKILDSIQLEFNDIKTVEYGSEFTSGSLIKNGNNEIEFNEINTKQLGEQTIIFKVTKEGVTKEFEYKITVVDTVAPVITLTKEKDTIVYNASFDMNKYIKTVTDNVDDKLEYKKASDIKDDDVKYYTYVGEVNTKKAGTYKVKVTAVDSSKNKSEKELSVIVSKESEKTPSNNNTSTTTPTTPNTGSNNTYVPNKNNKVIVINAGHQGKSNNSKEPVGPNSSVMKAKVSSGATGVSSRMTESQITLDVALKLRDVLQSRGYTVVMTRTSQNVNISNKERAEIGNKNNAAAVISIHCDSTTNSSTRGAHTIAPKSGNPYNPQIYSASSSLAQKVISSYCASTGIKSRGVSYRDDLTGLNWSTVPSIYLEMGFISNSTEDKMLSDSSFQNKCATGIANGIDNYFK
ncbi:MAG: N-acetylmuramoyl-L-alanine amidase [Coprobacillus sp.]